MDAANLQLGPLPILAWIPLLPLLGALINLVAGRRLPKWLVGTVAILSVGLAFVLSAYLVFGPLFQEFQAGRGGTGITQTIYTWIEVGSFKAQLALRLDTR